MGICLDTERNNESFEEEEQSWFQNSARHARNAVTPPEGQFPMLNGTNVQFELPKVPVIFVLGGPGSGKVTHCDNLAQEKQGIVHINMTDLLQQYTIGNDMQDFSRLSSRTVTEVLMLEMKMAPHAKAYLISGYPRNMRDVVEYSEKIQRLTGVILLAWREKILERQINYGAKLGQVVLSLARMEHNNFFKNVMPVADYFDHSNMLISINGERQPEEVYEDFKQAVMDTLSRESNPPELISVPTETHIPSSTIAELPTATVSDKVTRPGTRIISVAPSHQNSMQSPNKQWPPVLWIIGGPGSNKAILCDQAAEDTGWAHISLGRLLRSTADLPDAKHSQEAKKIRECLVAGELVPLDIILKIVESHLAANMNAPGILLDGYPRDMQQVAEFEDRFKQKPTIILLDCSKLQLGRGRLDDSVTAFRRRLEIFRQSSLPMLRTLDGIGRLTIVDGDTDTTAVREDFLNVVQQHIEYLTQNQNNLDQNEPPNIMPNRTNRLPTKADQLPNGNPPRQDLEVVNLEDEPEEPIQTISGQVHQLQNGVAHAVSENVNRIANIGNSVNHMANGVNHMANSVKQMANGVKHMAKTRAPSLAGIADHVNMQTQSRPNLRNAISEIGHM